MLHYDIVYKSKVFSEAYSKDSPDPQNADAVIRGGTGYAIALINGREVYDKSKDPEIPPEIEQCFPDYSIYPDVDFAVAMTSRGCPRGRPFCHVAAKEGRKCQRVATVSDFWNGQSKIKVLDPNLTACPQKEELLEQYMKTGAEIEFTQGLDIRLLTERDIEILNRMRLRGLHFAWDNPKDDLTEKFQTFASLAKHRPHGAWAEVFVLTNYNSTMEENLFRIYTLRDLGYDPYVMIYDKPHAPDEIRRLQRWCNSKWIFKSCPNFEDYMKEDRAVCRIGSQP